MTDMKLHTPTRQAQLEAYQALHTQEPNLRARELAARLGISEGELLACRQGQDSWLLRPQFQTLLESLEPLGEVLALTRNAEAVHERRGIYRNLSFSGNGRMGLVVTPDIDLRLFMEHWHCAFAVTEGERDSLQFFDPQGTALHKIYRTDETDAGAWAQLVARFRLPADSEVLFDPIRLNAPVDAGLPADFEQTPFRRDWAALSDVHQYHALLRRYGLSRTQALREIGEEWAWPLSPRALRQALQRAADGQCEVMVFVGNRGCIQIHSGPVEHLLETGPWFNVLDPSFNLHLREDQIAEAWAITRPTSDGIVTSIEAFNASGDSILTLFGKRKPGIPELQQWREIVFAVDNLKPGNRPCA